MTMNTFVNNLENAMNYNYTENGGLTHTTTGSKVYDMFAQAGAYRNRPEGDCILLFKNAYEENPILALKCLFWSRDSRGGAGERRFFRVCFNWFAKTYPKVAEYFIPVIAEYGRYDDLYCLVDTPIEKQMFDYLSREIVADMKDLHNPNAAVSLCGKWLKRENSSSRETKRLATKTRIAFDMTSRDYRKMLSALNKRINVVECLMSQNRWTDIEFDKLPSKAGLRYKNAFMNRPEIAEQYKAFIESKETKVHSSQLFPYEIVNKALRTTGAADRKIVEKYWNNLPNYFNKESSMLCVCDTSGSMRGNTSAAPINIAISLSLYCAERAGGPFHNKYISFSSRPQLIECQGVDFVDKVQRIYRTNLCDNTDLEEVFELLLKVARNPTTKQADLPSKIIVISDMEVDYCSECNSENEVATMMEQMRKKWASYGLKLPDLVYWCVDSRHSPRILDAGHGVSYVSGASPTIFTSILSGKNGYSLMLETLNNIRYEKIGNLMLDF